MAFCIGGALLSSPPNVGIRIMSWRYGIDHDDDSGIGGAFRPDIMFFKDNVMNSVAKRGTVSSISIADFYATLMGVVIDIATSTKCADTDRVSAVEVARKLAIDMADIPLEEFEKVRNGNVGLA